jgi:thiamine pyrophosphate-dependent acetolactate synthase large subunit-like protein
MATVADQIIATLKASRIQRVYGLPGDSLNGFTDAIRRAEGITWEHVRHEEAAAFAAAADAALTGGLAVCAGSCGPGNLHLINGLYDAQRSALPVLAIAAHIPLDEIGSDYFQETHPQQLFKECSVYCELVSTPEMAMRSAVEERGVAVVVIPGEVLLSRAAKDAWDTRRVMPARSVVRPDDESLNQAAQILNGSNRVTILAGAGAAGAHDELIGLAARLHAPIVHALRGKEYIEYDNPYDVGMTGLLGFASGYKAIREAEVLLMLGTDFPLLTLVENKLPVKVVVFNNASLSFVELEMKASGFVNFGTDLHNPDFGVVARALGIFGARVEKPRDLESALAGAFAHDGPAVVDVVTARQELTIPPAISAEQAKGFTLYAIRTILAGRGDELLDLVTTNVARRILD